VERLLGTNGIAVPAKLYAVFLAFVGIGVEAALLERYFGTTASRWTVKPIEFDGVVVS
jgi:hypothetical protein